MDKGAAKTLLVALNRTGKLSRHELAVLLGLDRFQTADVLKRYRVAEDLITPQDLDERLATLRGLIVVVDTSPLNE